MDPDRTTERTMELEILQLSKNFECVKSLGEGSYGKVTLVKDIRSESRTKGQQFALKRHFLGCGVKEQALKEAELLTLCEHENVVSLKLVFMAKGRDEPCMLLEPLDYDLVHLLSRVELTQGQVRSIIRQVLQALKHCHSKQVVHRDVSLRNVMLKDDTGVVKLIDFGLATRLGDDPDESSAPRAGHVAYRAPEILLGEAEFTPAADIWSAGCVFAELLDCRGLLFRSCQEVHDKNCDCNKSRFVFKQILKLCGIGMWAGAEKLPEFETVARPSLKSASRNGTFRDRFAHVEDQRAVALLAQMLTMDPNSRISAEAALESDYFQ